MSQVNNFKDLLLFEVQKAFYDERGKGARYRLTLAGVSYLQEQLKEKAADLNEIKKWLTDNDFVKDVQIVDNEISFSARVSNCCLGNICAYFKKEGMQPLGCPIANMFMHAIDEKTGLSPELLPIKLESECCGLTLAKIATSDVVEGK